MTSCIECTTAGKDGSGYPVITFRGKRERAHRAAYKLFRGDIPKGMVVRHICDNKLCINPAHLLLGTHADNVNDRVKRNRSAVGEKNGRSKLVESQVKEIFYDNTTKIATLARIHKVDPRVVRDIKQHKTWRYLNL